MVDRASRLSDSWEIQRVQSTGRSSASGPLVARILPNKLVPPRNRYTVITGKRVGKAHERNRCKRVTREALRILDSTVMQGFDVVVIVRGGPAELVSLQKARDALTEIFRKVNLAIEK